MTLTDMPLIDMPLIDMIALSVSPPGVSPLVTPHSRLGAGRRPRSLQPPGAPFFRRSETR
jgi:hypothetical protein